ncbi:DUF2325 domain-containing protein [Paenibacillus xerothermodurans]|uniref:DUF2325 domain-containing protein n=1 Tax=Paenibacillus xerothermodurans TaxID=1977292 RepID=A0A2W1NTK9_PAEXE|nr:DUF2325 domain-containing protein [Paenibacillus xerothermodurans]PZE19002.1 DUF2325 domain-containing protein [Paenibacillus xerothermodurans]
MPAILVVGADHLGNMPEQLASIGFNEVVHMSGRKCQSVRRSIPEKVDAVLVLTDYINHNLTKVIKQQAKEQDLPIFYAKRAWCSVQKALCSCAQDCELARNGKH